MELRFTSHARRAMVDRRITHEMVVATINGARAIEVGRTATIYDAEVDARLLRVVVVRGSYPPIVVTVHERDR